MSNSYICLGLSALDHTWFVNRLPELGAKALAEALVSTGGGMAATAAVSIAALGGEVEFWGRAGADEAGAFIRDELDSQGVDVANFRLFAGARTPVASVVVDPLGERQIATFLGRSLPDSAEWLPIDAVKSAVSVLADMRWIDGAELLFREARLSGIPTVLDADISTKDDFNRILPLTDYAIFSMPGLKGFAPEEDVDEALERAGSLGCRVVAVTDGGNGVRWLENGRKETLPAFDVEVVDTTGAGDVFHGAFSYAIGQSMNCRNALLFAAAAAALKCTHSGTRIGIPTKREIQVLLESNP